MKLSLDWIHDYIGELPDDPKTIGVRMTLATAEIEGIEIHGEDSVYDIDNKSLTHRPDLWGHYGFAREVAAVYHKELSPLNLGKWGYPESSTEPLQVNVSIDQELCPRYSGLVIEGIKVEPSPDWLVERLEKAGARAINNIVDLTNYVMFELGQPMHAFDRSKISGNQIQVRLAHEGEKIETLDGEEHELSHEMMIIADAEKAVAIAGVMGGANSEVNESTTSMVLESANFHPTHVRRTAAKLGIRTDSSMRFEKGLDPVQTETAIRRFTTLLMEICPTARVTSPLLDDNRSNQESIVINTSFDFINRRLGTNLESEVILGILERLAFKVKIDGHNIQVTAPSFRSTGDISIPMDLVEEVGRVFGYDNITPIKPLTPVKPVQMSPLHSLQRHLRAVLSRDLGFYEVYNYGFVGDKLLETVGSSAEGHIALANPLASDQNLLRTSLVPNMLKITAENLRFRKSFRIYELERVFLPEKQNEIFEHDRFELCGLICDTAWKKGTEDIFFGIKGALEDLLSQLPQKGARRYRPAEGPLPNWCHPGRTADVFIGSEKIGYLTQLHPQITQNLGIKAGVGFFVLDISKTLEMPVAEASFEKVQKYPTVPFDISMITDEHTLIADVQEIIQAVSSMVKKIELFDVYTGDNIGAGKKSLAFKITFAASDHTLQPEEIETLQSSVMKALDSHGHMVRDGST